MNVQSIPIHKIRIPETRVTAVYDEELTKLLKDTMTAVGMIQPIVVVKTGEEYHLVDGLHRLQESIRQGQTEVSAAVYEGEAKDALLLNLVTNHTRGKTKASELVQVIAALFKSYGMNIEGIVEKTGFTRDYIERLLQISSAHPAVLDLLDREIIGVSHAYEISRLPNPRQQDELASKQRIWRWTVKDLHEFVDAVLAEMEKMRTEPPQSPGKPVIEYHCEACDRVTLPKQLRAVMLCPDCYGTAYRAAHVQPATTTEPGKLVDIGVGD